MDKWHFKLNERSAWYWDRVDDKTSSLAKRSDDEFTTLFLCVRDAEKHGYTVPHYGAQPVINTRPPGSPQPPADC